MQTNWTTHWTMDTRIASTKMKLEFQTCFYVTDVGKLATVNLEFILSLEGVSLQQHKRKQKKSLHYTENTQNTLQIKRKIS